MGLFEKDPSAQSSTAEETWYAKDIELRERFHEQDAAALAVYQDKYLAAMQENSDAIRSLEGGEGTAPGGDTEASVAKYFMGALLKDWGSASRTSDEVLMTAQSMARAYLAAYPGPSGSPSGGQSGTSPPPRGGARGGGKAR